MVRESISKLKKKKFGGPWDIVTEIVKTVGEAGLDMITYLVNQFIVEGVIPVEWELVGKTRYCRSSKLNGTEITRSDHKDR